MAEAVPESDFEGFPAGEGAPAKEEDGVVKEEIVTLRRDMELEVDTEDIEDLITNELTTEELVALQQEEMSTEATEEEGEGEEVLGMSDIKELLKQWETVCTVILLCHPNRVVASQSVNIFEENVLSILGKC